MFTTSLRVLGDTDPTAVPGQKLQPCLFGTKQKRDHVECPRAPRRGRQIVDTLFFITIAFYGVFPIGNLLLGQIVAKVVVSILLAPILTYAFVAIGRGLDESRDHQLL